MSVIGAVSHYQSIARSLLQQEFAFVRVGFPVHEPQIEFPGATWDLFEHKFDGLLRLGRVGFRISKDGVVPRHLWWVDPLRLMMLPRIFHHCAKARLTNHFLG